MLTGWFSTENFIPPDAVGSAPFTLHFLLKLSNICVPIRRQTALQPRPSKSETLDIMIFTPTCQANRGMFRPQNKRSNARPQRARQNVWIRYGNTQLSAKWYGKVENPTISLIARRFFIYPHSLRRVNVSEAVFF